VSLSTHPRTLIAGIGNIFLGDDGFGCETVRELQTMELPESVRLVDYGIRGLDLAYAMLEPYENIVLIDAISRGGRPGTVYVLQPVKESVERDRSLNPHAMDPASLMALARSMGEIHAEIFIIGCEPEDFGDELEGRMGLSDTVRSVLPEAARAAAELVELLERQTAVPVENPLSAAS
jgi:hydrogenase maturation protease